MVSEDSRPARNGHPEKLSSEPSHDIITSVPLPLKEKGAKQQKIFQSFWLKLTILLFSLLVLLAGGWSFLNRLGAPKFWPESMPERPHLQ